MSVDALPAGTVLLHAGPHKTGTTALQFAAAGRRDELTAHGVRYPGERTQHSAAARSVGGRGWGWADRGGKAPSGPEAWEALLAQVRATDDTVWVSSEFFGELDPEPIARIAADLGERLHVVLTLRPLTRLLPSSWQQYLKGGATRPFDDWLGAVLADPPDPRVTPSFWQRQDHGALARRWADGVGADRVTVLVVDESDRAALPRTFETLLGLPSGLLDPLDGTPTNRSMTAAECELVRQANLVLAAADVGWRNYERAFRNAGVVRMVEARRPEPDEDALVLPAWAVERARELGARAADEIGSCGVRVLGDLGLLSAAVDVRVPAASTTPPPAAPPTVVPVASAVDLAVGVLSGAMGAGPFFGEDRKQRARLRPPEHAAANDAVDGLPVHQATTPELVRVLRRRLTERLRRRG